MNGLSHNIIADVIDKIGVERTNSWRFVRGTVQSVSSENAADILVEGNVNLTKNVPALINYNPRVDDKVLVLRMGIGGSNMILFGVIPSGTYKVGEWYNATLLSTWTNYGSPYANAGYCIDSHARVRLRGLVKDSSLANMISLPTKFRPSESMFFPVQGKVVGFNYDLALYVGSNGYVRPYNPYSDQTIDWVSLDGVSFKAA